MSKSSAALIALRLDVATAKSPIAVFDFYGEYWACFANTVCSQIMIRDGRFLVGVYDRDSIARFNLATRVK